jgi:hypothetical protein
MRYPIRFLAVILLAAMILPGAAALADGPVPKMPWLHEGLLLTYAWSAAKSDASGQGASASGLNQITIVNIDNGSIIGVTQGYGAASALNAAPVPLPGNLSFMVSAATPGDYWCDPGKLLEMQTDNSAGILVTRQPWTLNGQDYDSIQIQQKKGDSFQDHVYDVKTGLCLHSELTQGGVISGTGSDMFQTKGDYLAMRDLSIPWSGENAPGWIATFKALHYRGSVEMHGSLPQVGTILSIDMVSSNHGVNWLEVNSAAGMQLQGMPPQPPSKSVAFYGRSQFAGLWAGPIALAKLTVGQVLDQDPLTQMKTTVTKADDHSVQIASTNSSGEIDSQYDKQSGMLLSSSFFNIVSQQKWILNLQSKE